MINGSGQKVRTSTLPDGSTQVETFYRDGQMKEVGGSAAHPVKYEYGVVSPGLRFAKEIRIGQGASEIEWTKTYRDLADRTVKAEYPSGAQATSHYNNVSVQAKPPLTEAEREEYFQVDLQRRGESSSTLAIGQVGNFGRTSLR